MRNLPVLCKERVANVRERDQYGGVENQVRSAEQLRCTMLGNAFIMTKRQLPYFLAQNTRPLSDVRVSLYRVNARAGYTLIEVIIAMAVLIAGFAALTMMVNRARQAAIAAEELSIAQLACQTRVNEMLAGVRPIGPAFNEPVAELDHWHMTTELFPTTKPGLTAVRVQLFRERQPGDVSGRRAATGLFEITSWVDNSRLDTQIVQALQRNPYSMMFGGQMQGTMQNGPFGNQLGGVGTSLADSMVTGDIGMMPGIPGAMTFDMPNTMTGGMQDNSSFGGMQGDLPMFDATATSGEVPPLSVEGDFNADFPPGVSTDFSPAGDQSFSQTSGMTSDLTAGSVPPLDVPTDDVSSGSTLGPSSDNNSNTLGETSSETPVDINVEGINNLPDPENEAESDTTTDGEVTP